MSHDVDTVAPRDGERVAFRPLGHLLQLEGQGLGEEACGGLDFCVPSPDFREKQSDAEPLSQRRVGPVAGTQPNDAKPGEEHKRNKAAN